MTIPFFVFALWNSRAQSSSRCIDVHCKSIISIIFFCLRLYWWIWWSPMSVEALVCVANQSFPSSLLLNASCDSWCDSRSTTTTTTTHLPPQLGVGARLNTTHPTIVCELTNYPSRLTGECPPQAWQPPRVFVKGRKKVMVVEGESRPPSHLHTVSTCVSSSVAVHGMG